MYSFPGIMDIRDVLAVISVIFAMGLAIAGLILPPLGVIDTSIVWFFAQALLFAGTLLEVPNIQYLIKERPTSKK